MTDITTRTVAPPVAPLRRRLAGKGRRLLHRLSALAMAAADRLTSTYRDVPPESYRFPPF